jgi:hypothetical protein
MLRCASYYPISQLIYRTFQESGLKRSQFIASLGYRNITGGLRSLDRWLDCGEGDPLLIDRLVQVYRVHPSTIHGALMETEAQHKAEHHEEMHRREQWECQNFHQYVFIETPAGVVRSSFTVAAIAAPAVKTIRLPEGLVAEPESEQIQFVAELIRAHLNERGGKLSLFGDIVGYRFVCAYDESIQLDTTGSVIERVTGQFIAPGGSIQIGRKTVAPTPLLSMFGGLRSAALG